MTTTTNHSHRRLEMTTPTIPSANRTAHSSESGQTSSSTLVTWRITSPGHSSNNVHNPRNPEKAELRHSSQY